MWTRLLNRQAGISASKGLLAESSAKAMVLRGKVEGSVIDQRGLLHAEEDENEDVDEYGAVACSLTV